jgi:hypothetical protein
MHSIIFHAHQKLDRVARKHLESLLPGNNFPSIKEILKFEAGHGPDGAKLKRQQSGGEQPWHFVNPHDVDDNHIYEQITIHYEGLTDALVKKDKVRASFDAAWLAHALVDGMTPAHHYPYEKELEELQSGKGRNSRKGLTGRLYVKGDTVKSSFKQSMKLVGPKGLLTSHAMFEAGAYTLIAPLKLADGLPSQAEQKEALSKGLIDLYRDRVQEIADMEIYDRFCVKGWTQTISQEVRKELAPRMVKMITLSWFLACHSAQETHASN